MLRSLQTGIKVYSEIYSDKVGMEGSELRLMLAGGEKRLDETAVGFISRKCQRRLSGILKKKSENSFPAYFLGIGF